MPERGEDKGGAVATETSLLSRLVEWVNVQPDKLLFTFLDDQGNPTDQVTYKQAWERAVSIAWGLKESKEGLSPGDRVLLVFLPSLDFIMAFLGCLLAGLVPVPVFPPDPRKLKKDLYMFASIQASSGARVALTHSSYNHLKKVADIQNLFKVEKASWPDSLIWLSTDKLQSSNAPNPTALSLFLDKAKAAPTHDPCFLQYTSGSTSAPKGVVITHANLAHNLSIITQELQANTSTVVVSWLPQYHDMGLIGSYLGLAYCGGSGYYMSPLSFIRNPVMWVVAISKYRGTHMQAPNFAYGLTSRKYNSNPVKGLDLSSVKHMINAAEPVDGPSIDSFYKTFSPVGLPPGVIYPTYGLAEHTVFVCSNGRQRIFVKRDALETEQRVEVVAEGSNEEVKKTMEVVGCGVPLAEVDVAIADPETCQRLPEGRVGEVWVSSRSKAKCYFNLETESQDVFYARLLSKGGEEEGNRYLRTGDLGFVYNKEVFICGRIKDLIIVRGRNHYPQDIERHAEQVAAELRGGCSAAFAVNSKSGEVIALVAEVRELSDTATYKAVVDRVFQSLSQEDGVILSHLWLLRPRTVPKTTSGKIARKWCLRAFNEGTLDAVYKWVGPQEGGEGEGGQGMAVFEVDQQQQPPPQTLEPLAPGQFQTMTLDDILNRLIVLASRSVPVNTDRVLVPLMALGMDSMALGQFKGTVEQYFAAQLPDELFFQENINLKRVGVLLYAVGHGRDPHEAMAQYEANATAFELEAGADISLARPKGRFDWVIQTSPCFLCCPCCR